VYRHLYRLIRIADASGIPVVRVSCGHIRSDALDPGHRFASMPLYTLGPAGERGMARRQCTTEYKIRPIKAEVRRRLGYPHPKRCDGQRYLSLCQSYLSPRSNLRALREQIGWWAHPGVGANTADNTSR
jgi:hypothetical protein